MSTSKRIIGTLAIPVIASIILEAIKEKKHPGFKREFFMEHGIRLERSYLPPYKLLEAIDKAFSDQLS